MAKKKVHVEFDAEVDSDFEHWTGRLRAWYEAPDGRDYSLIVPADATITPEMEDGYYFNDTRGADGRLYRRVGGIWETRVDGDWTGAAYNTDAGHTEDLYLGPIHKE